MSMTSDGSEDHYQSTCNFQTPHTTVTGGAAWGEADLCMRNICKMIAKPKIQSKELDTHTPMAPQIMLYFGVAKGVAQLKFFGRIFVIDWDFLLKRFFSYNIHASRSWGWLGTSLSKETADL
ncbi:hypothetical protein BGX20_002937 [Mortierella sp. AD010]|nr:hypothetical protein BGX20_002937 [Mortierella sp. AD010]